MLLVIFGLILAMFFKSLSYDFDVIAHAGAPLGVEWLENFIKLVWTIFEKLEIFIKRSVEKLSDHEKKKEEKMQE